MLQNKELRELQHLVLDDLLYAQEHGTQVEGVRTPEYDSVFHGFMLGLHIHHDEEVPGNVKEFFHFNPVAQRLYPATCAVIQHLEYLPAASAILEGLRCAEHKTQFDFYLLGSMMVLLKDMEYPDFPALFTALTEFAKEEELNDGNDQ